MSVLKKFTPSIIRETDPPNTGTRRPPIARLKRWVYDAANPRGAIEAWAYNEDEALQLISSFLGHHAQPSLLSQPPFRPKWNDLCE